MTASKVDGQAVIAVEPVESPLSTPDKPIMFTRIVRLLLDDDTEVFGCSEDDCEYTGSSVGYVRYHVNRVHNGGPIKGSASSTVADPRILDITLGELLYLADNTGGVQAALERMTEDRNEWKSRARKAEASLATLKRVLS